MDNNPFRSIMTERYARNILDHMRAGTRVSKYGQVIATRGPEWSPAMIMLYPRSRLHASLYEVDDFQTDWSPELIQWIDASPDEVIWRAMVEAAVEFFARLSIPVIANDQTSTE